MNYYGTKDTHDRIFPLKGVYGFDKLPESMLIRRGVIKTE